MQRIPRILVVALSCTTLLAACQGAASTSSPKTTSSSDSSTPVASTPVASTPVASTPVPATPAASAAREPITLQEWDQATASDGIAWAKMIDNFNAAHKDQGIQIKRTVVDGATYGEKLAAASATGHAPDIGFAVAGFNYNLVKAGNVLVPMDDLVTKVGLDLNDFTPGAIDANRYPSIDPHLYGITTDIAPIAMLINGGLAKAAGLDTTKPPTTLDELVRWAKAMTTYKDGKVDQSGFLMTGSGNLPTMVWGIVAAQMGFKRTSDDLKAACVNPEAAKTAMQFVLDLFDKYKVSSRDITDRYAAFGAGQAGMFWTGPWTIRGFQDQDIDVISVPVPLIGTEKHTQFDMDELEMYTQPDTSRYEASMEAIKWLSDNSFVWTTEGGDIAVRKSVLSQPGYSTPGDPRSGFIESVPFADLAEIPIASQDDFNLYGSAFTNPEADAVVAGTKTIDQFVTEVCAKWQADLDGL